MKAFRILLAVVSLGVIVSYSGCGSKGGSSETTQDKQFGLLSAQTWKVSTVSLGGIDQSASYPAGTFQLTISGTKGQTTFNYACPGRPALSPWPSNGTWAFGTDPVTQIIRDKGTANELAMTYIVTASTLQINFTYSGSGYTRVNNVSGQWVFNFTK
jgi:hypothetical protein